MVFKTSKEVGDQLNSRHTKWVFSIPCVRVKSAMENESRPKGLGSHWRGRIAFLHMMTRARLCSKCDIYEQRLGKGGRVTHVGFWGERISCCINIRNQGPRNRTISGMCEERPGGQNLKRSETKQQQDLRGTLAIVRTRAVILNEVGAFGEV